MVLRFRVDGCATVLTAAAGGRARGKSILGQVQSLQYLGVMAFDLAAHAVRFLLLVSFSLSEPIRVPCLHVFLAALILWMTPIVIFLSALPPSNPEYQQCRTAVFQNVSHNWDMGGEQRNSTCRPSLSFNVFLILFAHPENL